LKNSYGFDISWSRLKVGMDFMKENIKDNPNFFVADFSSIPLCDNSIDVVYTSHSIEPNGGNEKHILEELYRITKNYLVLFEPDYELASDEAKIRMENHGYAIHIASTAKMLGYNIIKRKLLEYSTNPLNPTSVIVIEKSSSDDKKENDNIFQCPITKTKLIDYGEVYFAPQSHIMYPVIRDIPCLLKTQAIFGFKYL